MDPTDYERVGIAIPTQLPEELHAAAYAEGQALSREQAIAYAPEEEPPHG